MTLYKNVDICDLESILKNGILSMNKCGNNNWSDHRRTDNSTSVVYLFKPLPLINTFPEYGIALLEVDCDAVKNEMAKNDVHNGEYVEYVVSEVKPNQIKRVIIPEIFKDRIILPPGIKAEWCGMYAEECTGYDRVKGCAAYSAVSAKRLDSFAKTASLNTTDFNYFRGVDENKEIIDLYNIVYIF